MNKLHRIAAALSKLRTPELARALLIVALVAMGLAACSPAAPATPTAAATSAPAAAFPVTITDDANTPVTVKAEPKRIVSLAPAHTETLFALGLGDRVAGVTTFCDYPEAAKGKPKVGDYASIDLEKVVGINPDLVLASSLHAQTAVPALRQRGITVAVVEPKDVAGTLARIVTIGQLTGRTTQAQSLTKDIQARLDAIAARVGKGGSRPRVFWELGADLFSAGKGSFIDDLITRAGGENIGSRLAGEWPQFNLEGLLAADPQVIVLADHPMETAATVKARPGWSSLSAVKQGRIVEVTDINIVSRQGPRIAEGVEFIARALNPDLFK